MAQPAERVLEVGREQLLEAELGHELVRAQPSALVDRAQEAVRVSEAVRGDGAHRPKTLMERVRSGDPGRTRHDISPRACPPPPWRPRARSRRRGFRRRLGCRSGRRLLGARPSAWPQRASARLRGARAASAAASMRRAPAPASRQPVSRPRASPEQPSSRPRASPPRPGFAAAGFAAAGFAGAAFAAAAGLPAPRSSPPRPASARAAAASPPRASSRGLRRGGLRGRGLRRRLAGAAGFGAAGGGLRLAPRPWPPASSSPRRFAARRLRSASPRRLRRRRRLRLAFGFARAVALAFGFSLALAAAFFAAPVGTAPSSAWPRRRWRSSRAHRAGLGARAAAGGLHLGRAAFGLRLAVADLALPERPAWARRRPRGTGWPLRSGSPRRRAGDARRVRRRPCGRGRWRCRSASSVSEASGISLPLALCRLCGDRVRHQRGVTAGERQRLGG